METWNEALERYGKMYDKTLNFWKPCGKENKMIKYICNACGRVVKDIEAETLVIYKGLDCKEYMLCPTCSKAIKKELEKGEQDDK